MGYSIYDPPNQNTAIAGGASAQPGIMALLQDRNFLQLLAGVGAGLDPRGVGGALGGATKNYVSSVAAQERAAKTEQAQNAQTQLVLQALKQYGGLTDKETPGVTSFSATPEGVKMEVTPTSPGLQQPIAPAQADPTKPQMSSSRERVNSLLPFYSALMG